MNCHWKLSSAPNTSDVRMKTGLATNAIHEKQGKKSFCNSKRRGVRSAVLKTELWERSQKTSSYQKLRSCARVLLRYSLSFVHLCNVWSYTQNI